MQEMVWKMDIISGSLGKAKNSQAKSENPANRHRVLWSSHSCIALAFQHVQNIRFLFSDQHQQIFSYVAVALQFCQPPKVQSGGE